MDKTISLTPAELAWLIDELQTLYEMEYSEHEPGEKNRVICETIAQKLLNA